MAREKPPAVDFTTDRVVFGYTKLDAPDEKFNKYSVQWRLRAQDFPADVMAKIVALRDELAESTRKALVAEGKSGKANKLVILPILREEEDKQTGEPTGFVIVNPGLVASVTAKRGPNAGKTYHFTPEVYDAGGNILKKVPRVFAGSEGCLHMLAQPYYFPADNEVGVKWVLVGVQILSVGERQPRTSASHGFKPQQGYVGGQEEEREPGSDDAQGEDGIPY